MTFKSSCNSFSEYDSKIDELNQENKDLKENCQKGKLAESDSLKNCETENEKLIIWICIGGIASVLVILVIAILACLKLKKKKVPKSTE